MKILHKMTQTRTHHISGYDRTVKRDEVDEEMFITTVSSTVNLINIASVHIQQHQEQCIGARFEGHTCMSYMKGHCAVACYTCQSCHLDLPNWPSSPYLPNNKFLVNYRMAHFNKWNGLIHCVYNLISQLSYNS